MFDKRDQPVTLCITWLCVWKKAMEKLHQPSSFQINYEIILFALFGTDLFVSV